jgi:hypothetical protein
MSNEKLGTVIDGIGASEVIDSSGEVISIEGIDTSSLDVDGLINTEHSSNTTTQLIGKVVSYHKIFKKEDCQNSRQRYFWDKVEAPYLYIKAVLFDKFNHSGAQDAVAMMRFDKELNKDNTRQVGGFSIEGSRLGKEGNRITKCIARKIAWTAYPCNKTCVAEILEEDKPIEITAKQLLAAFKKSEDIESDLKKADYNTKLAFKLTAKPKKVDTYKPITTATGEHREGSEIKPKAVSTPAKAPEKQKVGQRTDYTGSKKKMKTGYQIYNNPDTWKSETNTVRQSILKNMSNQNIKRRMMLSEKKENMRKDILKKMADDAFEHFEKKEELLGFVTTQYPEMTEQEVLAFAKTFAYVQMKKSEMEMVKITDNIEGNDLQKASRSSKHHAEQVASGKKSKWESRYKESRGPQKGVHNKATGLSSEKHGGTSEAGAYVKGNKAKARDYDFNPEKRSAQIDEARKEHHKVIREQKEMKAPNLPKSETDVVKADHAHGYSEKNPKIDIHHKGRYHASTNWSKTLKQAKEKHLERNPEHKPEDVKAYYSDPKPKKK